MRREVARLLGRSKKCHRGIDVSSNADLARAAAREGAIPPPLEKQPGLGPAQAGTDAADPPHFFVSTSPKHSEQTQLGQ